MIQIKTVSVTGFEGAIRGMRLPMQSEGDSKTITAVAPGDGCAITVPVFVIGPKDLELALKLAKAGPDHGKFLRMIHVQALITAPQYFVAELATYKVGTVMNSSSLQHKGASRDFTLEDFSVDDWPVKVKNAKKMGLDEYPRGTPQRDAYSCGVTWESLLLEINSLRRKHKETGDYSYFRLMRQLIPMSYNYTVMWDANYQTLRTIYHQRKHHRLREWSGPKGFCEWAKTLPHSELVTEV